MKSSGKYENLFGKYVGITFPSGENPSIMRFIGITDGTGKHIGYKMISNANSFMKRYDRKAYYGEFPAELCAGKHLIFIYSNIIEDENVGDNEAPLLRVIGSKHHEANKSQNKEG